MEDGAKKDIVPDQQTGQQTNTEYAIVSESRENAQEIFKAAANRLLDVNHWEKLCGSMSADFKLTDQDGNEIERHAEKGDHFKIDIPGPGGVEGGGYDWVLIEKIEERIDCENDIESLAIRVRPASNPNTKGNEVAHFFNEQATSSFVVERRGVQVKAGVYGRNEKPNAVIKNLVDKIRNAIIAVSAFAGISSSQWQNLSKGLLEGEKP